MASATASVRVAVPSFMRMLLTWNLTVDRLTKSFSAMSGLLSPCTISPRISSSRGRETLVVRRLGGRLDEHLSRLRRERGTTRVGPPDRVGELVGRDVLEQVADGPGLERALDQVVLLVAGEGDHLDVGAGVLDATGRLGAVHLRHDEVHEHHVRPQGHALADGVRASGGVAHVLEVVERNQEG